MDRVTPGRVFISYVTEDSAAASRLRTALESAGFQVWRPSADLMPGADWRAGIREAISARAVVFLACFSRASLAREVSYQREELSLAIEQSRLRSREVPWLIPVRLEDCEIPDWDIGGGRTLRSLEYVDLFGARREAELSRLAATVSKAVDPARGKEVRAARRRRILGLPVRAVVVVVAVLLGAGVITSAVLAARTSQGPGTGLLTVSGKPWVTTGNGRVSRTLTAGIPVRYAFEVDNPAGGPVSAGIRFEAYWGTSDQPPVNIFGALFTATLPPGLSTVYSPRTKIPAEALPGWYSEQADISARADPADHTGQYGTFDVAGRKSLAVPFLASPGGAAGDGAACVAMVLRSYPGARHPAASDVRDFLAPGGRDQVVASGAALENALAHFGLPEAAISQISLSAPGLPQAQVTAMAIAIRRDSPVIAFADGTELPSGTAGGDTATGRWVVVTGVAFSPAAGTEILVNDPDGQGGAARPVGLDEFERAVTDAAGLPAAQQEPDHIAGIIVTGAAAGSDAG
jgi:hypothetical protein